jgi:hypothetical protein
VPFSRRHGLSRVGSEKTTAIWWRISELLRERLVTVGESEKTRDWVAGAPGFEPGITGPKPVALPLGHAPIRFGD